MTMAGMTALNLVGWSKFVMPSVVFIYQKGVVGRDDQYKCLGIDADPSDELRLKDDGWALVASVNAAIIVENLLNLSDEGRKHMLNDLTRRSN